MKNSYSFLMYYIKIRIYIQRDWCTSGAGENTLRRLALFVYLDHPTKSDVTSGKKASGAVKSNFNMAQSFCQ